MQAVEHSVVVGEYRAPGVETRTAILAQVLAQAQAQTASGLFFPVLDMGRAAIAGLAGACDPLRHIAEQDL